MAGPTEQEQYQLELINEARLNPLASAARYITSYSPLTSVSPEIQNALTYFNVSGTALLEAFKALVSVEPLAWSSELNDAAALHTQAMIAADLQSHQLPGELGLGDRLKAAGYNFRTGGENVYAYSYGDLYTHAGFMVDWGNGPDGMQSPAGHRDNIMSANFSEVGIDITEENNARTQVGPTVVTENFGDRGLAFLTGVAYTDSDKNNFYTVGEGRGDLKVSLGSATVTSFSTGGYSLQAPSGESTFSLSGGGLSGSIRVTADLTSNLKLDVVNGNMLFTSGSIQLNGSAITEIRANGTFSGVFVIGGGDGNQKVIGSATQNNTLDGHAGNDYLIGGAGLDTLRGGDGDDFIEGGASPDGIDGGAGIDTAVYSGNRSEYSLRWQAGGGFLRVAGKDNGIGDVVFNIEYFKFADGTYSYDPVSHTLSERPVTPYVPGSGGGGGGGGGTPPPTNTAPTVIANQSITVAEEGSASVTVAGFDANGDALTYSAIQASRGVVTGGTNGQFVYTPILNFSGTDSFVVTVSDGKGGTAQHTVNINVTPVNDAPTVAATQNVATTSDTAKQFTVIGSDVDGDALTYSAGAASHGVVTGGSNGVFTYTPTAGYSGNDTFVVSVSDGKGGTVNQTVAVKVQFAPPPPPQSLPPGQADFQLFADDGYAGKIGGTGIVVGTNGFQDISLTGEAGIVEFDASLNKGGDIIRLPGNASDYKVSFASSTVTLSDGDTTYRLPIGTKVTSLVFADGARGLFYDTASNAAKIGSQVIGGVLETINEVAGSAPSRGAVESDAVSSLFLKANGDVTLGGDQKVFGTGGGEKLHYLYGDITLDASFNKGGDYLYFDQGAPSFKAYHTASTIIILAEGGDITIPVGTKGMGVDFAGSSYSIRFDTASGNYLIGEQVISATSRAGAQTLNALGSGSSNEISLDVGSGQSVVEVSLAQGAHVLTDNAAATTNVEIKGFDFDDVIKVTGADASDYNFTLGNLDGDREGDDLQISFSENGTFNIITIFDVVDAPGFVGNYETAVDVVGFDFITFG